MIRLQVHEYVVGNVPDAKNLLWDDGATQWWYSRNQMVNLNGLAVEDENGDWWLQREGTNQSIRLSTAGTNSIGTDSLHNGTSMTWTGRMMQIEDVDSISLVFQLISADVKDSDGDGLSDDLESSYGTNPFNSDTDGDGLGNPDTEGEYCLNDLPSDWLGQAVEDCSDNLPNCQCNENSFEDCYDCSGECNGNFEIDECGVCSDPENPSECDCPVGQVNDCALVCHDDINDNGICDDPGCAQYDDCGVCSGGSTGNIPNGDQDCNGDCFGDAFVDDCGICSEGNSGHDANSDQDCFGICPEDPGYGAFIDDCGLCSEGLT